MKGFILLIVCLMPITLFPQAKHDYVWLSGTSHPNNPNNILDFNSGQVTLEGQYLDTYFYLTNASMCDNNGKLMLYTNGCYIADASHKIMHGGNNLNPGILSSLQCPDDGYSASRGIITLPQPGETHKYYLFYVGDTLGIASPFGLYVNKLQYAIVDMELNNGLGAVIVKKKIAIKDTLYVGAFSAVRHTNNTDWWLITPRQHENKYFKLLLTANGIDTIIEQKIGIHPDPWSSGGAEAHFSPDGKQFAWFNSTNNVLLFDFDRTTGELSNFKQLFADTTDKYKGGLSFSPNSRYLYVSTRVKLWQFDLQASDIQASKTLVGEYDGFEYYGTQVTFYHMQLAPDCRIYMIATNGCPYMHVIHHPDRPGLECGFEQRGIKLPAVNAISLPNFPMYRLGTPYPICDSNIVIVSSPAVPLPQTEAVKVYPNPASEEITMTLSTNLPAAEWVLHNQLGQPVRQVHLLSGQQEATVEVNELPPGLYFWQIKTANRLLQSGKLVVSK